MKLYALSVAILTLATQAQALSCIRPDPIATFERVAEATESYFVLYGQLSFSQSALPQGGSNDTPANPAPIDAFFDGKGLTRDGFTSDYISPVQLQVTCAGPWCGSARSEVDALYFVRADTQPVTMTAGPCGGMIFEEPSQATLDMLESCMAGGACSPQPLQ